MNKSEIKKIKKACSITDKILKQLIKELRKHSFKTELDIYIFLKQKTKENNCKLAFKPIVATASNAAEIHHKATNTKLKKGFLIIDFGVKYKGYCSDCTRTLYLGKPSKKEKELYNLVLQTQLTAISYTLPRMNCGDLDAITRASFGEYMRYFAHGLGHGLGKRIHQSPNLKPNNRYHLKKGIILTIEPGLYFKRRFGIRIEDTILLKNRPIILTKTTKKLMTI